jgi:hypothetical protein
MSVVLTTVALNRGTSSGGKIFFDSVTYLLNLNSLSTDCPLAATQSGNTAEINISLYSVQAVDVSHPWWLSSVIIPICSYYNSEQSYQNKSHICRF